MDPRVGGRSAEPAVETVDEDFARVWLGTRGAVDATLAEGLRRCREVVSGGLDRSCLTGSEFWLLLDCRVENALWSPPVVGLPMLARAEGGRIEALLTILLPALGGLVDVDVIFRAGGRIGSRLGDWLLLSLGRGSGSFTLFSSGSWADSRVFLVPASAGLRRDRDREGTVAMSS